MLTRWGNTFSMSPGWCAFLPPELSRCIDGSINVSTSSQLVQVRKGVRDGIPLEAHHSDFHIGERSATQSISVPIEGHILKPNPPHKREKMSVLLGNPVVTRNPFKMDPQHLRFHWMDSIQLRTSWLWHPPWWFSPWGCCYNWPGDNWPGGQLAWWQLAWWVNWPGRQLAWWVNWPRR